MSENPTVQTKDPSSQTPADKQNAATGLDHLDNAPPGQSENDNATEDEAKNDYLDEVNVDEDIDMEFKDPEANANEAEDRDASEAPQPKPLPQFTRKDKTLLEFLNSMDQYSPIIPDAVTDFYLAKSGFETSDRRIKRLLALATQKFISDIASDAYQYSRIRSASSVSTSSNPQARAKALMAGMNAPAANANTTSGPNPTGQPTQANTGGMSGNQGKLVLTMEDLGSALAEYGLNVRRPDFYR